MRIGTLPRTVAVLTILIAALSVAAAEAQVTTGSISGNVSDPVGRPVPGATVLASDGARASARTAVTDEAGRYRFTDLAPALYDVAAAAQGFERVERRQVPVAVDSHVRLDFRLPVAGIVETVNVTAPLVATEPQSADVGTVIDQRRIQSLPLNKRDFLQLAMLTPGVNPPSQGSELSSRGSFAMNANGGREEYNNFLLDGVDNNDAYVNRFVVQPPVDSIQEFKIVTNSYNAEYGRSAAGQVNVITKSGTNRFELTAYEYFRNEALNARNAFDTEGEEPPFERNQFGASLGGPLWRNRTFAFASIDFLRERTTVTRLSSVPTDLQRAGNLSELPVTVYDPFTRQPFPGNIVPDNRIDPIARQVVELFPHANRPGLAGNYLDNAPYREDQNQATVRVDHRLSDRDQLMGRYNRGMVDAFAPYAEDAGTVPGFGNTYEDPANNAMLQYRRVLGDRALSTTRFGVNSYSRNILPENYGTDVGALWGVNWLEVPERDYAYPTMSIAGYSKVGDTGTLPIQRKSSTYQLVEAVTMDRGRHLWQFGGEVRHQRLDGNLDILARGSLSFSGLLSGAGMSDLLLGFPSFTLQSKSDNTLRLRTTAFSAYAQDDWRVGPNVTVNLGLRYEYYSPATDPTNHMSAFNPDTGTVVPVGTGGVSDSGLSSDFNNVAPRVGIAWQVHPGLVIRGGYGLYYDSGMFEVNSAMYFNPPQFTMRAYFPTQYSLLTLSNPFPSNGGFAPPPSISTLDPNLVTSSMQHWNASVQRDVGVVGVFTASYAGSKGFSLIRSRDLNQPPPGPGDVQSRRPYPAYGSIFYIESAGRSTFNSLQLHLSRPLARGVSVWAAYTLSDSKDDGSAFLGTDGDPNFPQDSQNMAAQWGPSGFDVRHRFAASFIYQLPSGNAITRDTELRGIVTLQSGQPFTPLLRFDNSNAGNTGQPSGSDHPNLVGHPQIASRSASRWFNSSALAVPACHTFGDAGRNILAELGCSSADLALGPRTPIGGSVAVQVEAQVCNLFNRVDHDLLELHVDEPATFGRIFSAKAPREVQLALRVTLDVRMSHRRQGHVGATSGPKGASGQKKVALDGDRLCVGGKRLCQSTESEQLIPQPNSEGMGAIVASEAGGLVPQHSGCLDRFRRVRDGYEDRRPTTARRGVPRQAGCRRAGPVCLHSRSSAKLLDCREISMRKLVIALVLLAALGFAVPAVQAAPILSWVELGFKSSIDGTVYDNPYGLWPPPGAVFSAGFLATGLGTVTYTFNAPGSHYVAGFFDYQFVEEAVGNGLFDEWGFGSLSLSGLGGTIDDPWDGGAYAQFAAYDFANPFDGLSHLWGPSNLGNVAVGLGYTFTLAPGDPGRRVIFSVGQVDPMSDRLFHVDEPSGERVYFSLRTEDIGGGPVVPEPGTLTLLGLGLATLARRLRRG